MVPAICAGELAQLVAEGRLGLDRPVRDWVAQAVSAHPFTPADLSWEVAIAAVDLGREGFHLDPADRLIYATARALGAPLLSADSLMEAFERRLPARSPRLVVWD